jgi:hypothetical protein
MLHELTAYLQVGLLPPGNHSQVKLSVRGLYALSVWLLTLYSAYEIYKTPNKDDREMAIKDKTMPLSTQYRRIFGISRPVVLHFVGVWVSVALFPTTDYAADPGPRTPCPVLVSCTMSRME